MLHLHIHHHSCLRQNGQVPENFIEKLTKVLVSSTFAIFLLYLVVRAWIFRKFEGPAFFSRAPVRSFVDDLVDGDDSLNWCEPPSGSYRSYGSSR
jgi:hypothetical protein